LLVSASFVASDYCYGTEMTQALKRHSLRSHDDGRSPSLDLRPFCRT
jgi:hypothetical protein